MRRLLATVLIASLLFSGLVSAAGGHPEVLLDDGELVLHSDGNAEPTGLLDHTGDDHCCHSVAHFAGVLSDAPSVTLPPADIQTIAPPVTAFVGLTYPPLPKPPRA